MDLRRCKKAESPPKKLKKILKLHEVAPQKLSHLRVARVVTQALPRKFQTGRLHAGSLTLPCAIGAGKIKADKREGDGATPMGRMHLLEGYFRADRIPRPHVQFGLRPHKRNIGWCDEPDSGNYNRLITLPSRLHHEILWREDDLYNLMIVLNYNILPRVKHRGSAIFLHCRRPGLTPTEGCIALAQNDLLRLLPQLSARTKLTIGH
jgi:L,D-peptidoglycan transpeptidase YkuD (ErfK/YbiS/YcfS/YnhG family)